MSEEPYQVEQPNKEESNPRFIVDSRNQHYVSQKGSLRRVKILKQRTVKVGSKGAKKEKTLTDVAFVKRVRLSKKERLDARAKENGFTSHKDMLHHNELARKSVR